MNEESIAALSLLSRMRFACGDDGRRMQDELEEYLRELKRNADRYAWIRNCSTEDERLIEAEDEDGSIELKCGTDLDEAIDAAMNCQIACD